ncbi:MAG: Unknown protein [uncultured Sulfurovum sp.]|uniref:Outer membrane protein beta-barrel domain-containing protein n=1 Tax=uncultured Sulfurovum sp. TaxID=269237 RepID=A0A6S6TBW1_9BACT|nr:MAG: Unknown protein [uncultured Sulfurovum sp.]
MNFLKKTLTSLVLLSALSTAATFEQNGIKEGNNRISASARVSVPDEGDNSITLLAQYGHFLTDDIEVMVDLFSNTANSDTFYLLGLGANYYFAKTPTLTPFVGGQYYNSGLTGNSDLSANGTKVYLGAHQFLSENFAITPEAGAQFIDFSEYSEAYLNVYLTYFFD